MQLANTNRTTVKLPLQFVFMWVCVYIFLLFFFYACSERLIKELLVAFLDLRVGLRSWACVQCIWLQLYTAAFGFFYS